MPIYLTNRVRKGGVDSARVRDVAQRLLVAVERPSATLSISIVRDAAIRELNAMHRGKDAATDVLSFPLFEPGEAPSGETDIEVMLGDIVLSIDTATRQAAAYDAPLVREVERLLIHGVLHLLGHDHERDDERVLMEAEERRLATAIGMPWPY